MFSRLRGYWREFRAAPAGQRFRHRYARRAEERARGESQWSRPVQIGLAGLSLLIALPLTILPGPAILFYLLAAFLLAGESHTIAALCDRTDVTVRSIVGRWRRRRERRRRHPPGP